MAKKLSYFNLIYGVCLFALLKSEGDWIILIGVAIILLFNWIILKEVDGKYIISKSWLNGLMLLSFITSFLLLFSEKSDCHCPAEGRKALSINARNCNLMKISTFRLNHFK
jgi:hypothetical protein